MLRRTFSLRQSFNPSDLLSESNRVRTIKSLNCSSSLVRPLKRKPKDPNDYSAVLVPLIIHNGELSLLYTKRSSKLRSHGREMSFPGGKRDENLDGSDDSLTAIRETREELGIESDIQIWTTMNSVPDKSGKKCVTPVVGFIPDFHLSSTVKINVSEVDSALIYPISFLCDTQTYGITQFKIKKTPGYSLPVFNKYGGSERIWGMTAIITFQFLKSFIPNDIFKLKLDYQAPLVMGL